MENMRSFWQLSDELRGQNKGAEDHKWFMAATKLADQSWSKGERFHNLDLSKAPALGRPRENPFQEGSTFENMNFNMLNLDSKFSGSFNNSPFLNGYNNVNAAYQKSNNNSFGNIGGGKIVMKTHTNNADDKRFKTLPAAETLPRNEILGGYIFVCNNDTMQEDLKRLLFGLPPRYRDSVRAITPGLPLFLYNYTAHQLHGIFEAASFGGSNIDPTAWEDKKCKGESRFPAQLTLLPIREKKLLVAVRIRIRKMCQALEEDVFRPVLHHYDGPKLRLELSVPETLDLLDLCEKAVSAS
uniref:DCD domain-containing protein n=1 Tax=Kalanchoe fedtschenkoi TaxID=63787 RepID=A0A7N0ZSE4_KALFE